MHPKDRLVAGRFSINAEILSQLPKEKQYDKNQDHRAEQPARAVSPRPAMRPGGKSSDKQKDEDD